MCSWLIEAGVMSPLLWRLWLAVRSPWLLHDVLFCRTASAEATPHPSNQWKGFYSQCVCVCSRTPGVIKVSSQLVILGSHREVVVSSFCNTHTLSLLRTSRAATKSRRPGGTERGLHCELGLESKQCISKHFIKVCEFLSWFKQKRKRRTFVAKSYLLKMSLT